MPPAFNFPLHPHHKGVSPGDGRMLLLDTSFPGHFDVKGKQHSDRRFLMAVLGSRDGYFTFCIVAKLEMKGTQEANSWLQAEFPDLVKLS